MMNRRRFWTIAKTVVALVVIALVAKQFWGILTRPEVQSFQWPWRPEWWLAAGLLYLATHTLWGTYWWALLCGQNVRVSWATGLRAYYVSQFGKYIPMKIFTILLRVALLRGLAPPTVVAYTATCETLTNMAAGALLAACFLAPQELGPDRATQFWPIIAIVAATPLAFGLLRWLLNRAARNPAIAPPSWSLLGLGFVQSVIGWAFLALSLFCLQSAILPEPPPFTITEWARLLGIVTAAYVLGFLVLVSPGGLGPRDYLMASLLATGYQSQQPEALAQAMTVLVALGLRASWTVAEFIVAGVWALFPPRTPVLLIPEKPLL
ncbi:MAG: lysylphosphatidylglycerol synthase domain-containing protein [Gemmataceae bacterium]